MPRETYQADMDSVREELLLLSEMAAGAVTESVRILRDRLMVEGEELIEADHLVNSKCKDIEEACTEIIALQQPVARDLRFLISAMHISRELERIADYAKGICILNGKITPGEHLKPLVDVPRMAELTCGMLRDALAAFLEEDVDRAREIPGRDSEIDRMYAQVYRELLTHVMENPVRIHDAMMLAFVAHNLERGADRVVNICERIIYYATGEVVDY